MIPELVFAVLRAWTDPGPAPLYHREMQHRLRQDWPVLAAALDALAKSVAPPRGL